MGIFSPLVDTFFPAIAAFFAAVGFDCGRNVVKIYVKIVPISPLYSKLLFDI
jgi:hypothetical protein